MIADRDGRHRSIVGVKSSLMTRWITRRRWATRRTAMLRNTAIALAAASLFIAASLPTGALALGRGVGGHWGGGFGHGGFGGGGFATALPGVVSLAMALGPAFAVTASPASACRSALA